MTNPVEAIRSFYDKLKVGDATGALSPMSHDIEWIAMWHYKVNGRAVVHLAMMARLPYIIARITTPSEGPPSRRLNVPAASDASHTWKGMIYAQ